MRKARLATTLLLLAAVTTGCAPGVPSSTSPPTQRAPTSASNTLVKDGEEWVLYQRFVGDHFSIRVVRPDGSGDHALVSITGKPTHPSWSRDGSRVVFTVDSKQLWTVGADGSGLEQLPVSCDPDCYLLDSAAWAPDGESIAYTHITLANDTPKSSIETITLATKKVATLYTSPKPLELIMEGRWSPDGNSFVVDLSRYDDLDSTSPNGTAVGIINVRTGTLRMLVDWKMFATHPDFSPDGKHVVFSTYDLGDRDAGNGSDPYAASDLYVIAADGSGLTQLTHNATGKTLIRNSSASGPLSSQPRWSPDGASIVFVQVDGTRWPGWTLAKIAPDGTGLASATGPKFLLGTHPELRPIG